MTADTNPRASTFSAQVMNLAPGESASRLKRVDPTMTIARIPAEMPALRQQLRNAVTPAVTRAGKATGNTYTIEVGDAQMANGNLYIVAAVTCVATKE